jgi:hypothetical protein
MLTVALANTLFFSVDPHEARSRVALYLLVTMAPFAVVAPVVGPVLDRFRNGRRYAIATTHIVRAFLCWVMAGAIAAHGSDLTLYPAAFGALICSKAYGLTRSAVVPRVLPPSISLVRGNARLTLWGVISAAIAAPIAQGLTWATGTSSWALRLASLIYLAGAVFSVRLPSKVDSNEGEARLRRFGPDDEADAEWAAEPGVDDTETRVLRNVRPGNVGPAKTSLFRRILPPLRGIGARMPMMLRAISGLRAFSGFLTLFLAFLIREHPLGMFSSNVDLGIIVAAATLGSVAGTTIGAGLKSRRPEPLAIAALSMVSVMAIGAAIWFGLLAATLAILIGNLSSAIGKLGLDSVIQRDAADDVRTSAFARSETVLQLSWVAGGFIAIILPSNGNLGMALAAAVLVSLLALTAHALRNSPDRGIEQLRRSRAVRNAGVAR